jgi:hypothetical protein
VPKPGQSAAPPPGNARRIIFTLAPDLVSPKSATISEGPRDQTEIIFGVMQKNVVVDPARMRPPG